MALALACAMAMSCEQGSDVASVSPLDKLASEVTASSSFTNLGISLKDLNLKNVHYTNAAKDAIIIPFAGMDGKKGVLALLGDQNSIRSVSYFEAISKTEPDQVFNQLSNGTFDGSFVFGNEYWRIQLDVEKSQIVSRNSKKTTMANARTSACKGMTQPGGALDCAGARISSKNWLDATVCYITFVECLAQETISCAIDGCVVNPTK